MLPMPMKPSRTDFVIAGFTDHLSKVCSRSLLSRDKWALAGTLCSFTDMCFALGWSSLQINWVRLTIFSERDPTADKEHNRAEEKSSECEIENEYVEHVTTYSNECSVFGGQPRGRLPRRFRPPSPRS